MIPSVSPDLDAWVCYVIVAVVGLHTAIRQVNGHLKGCRGKWLVFDTWFLLLAYLFLPIALFFLLDCTGAIRDTSLFAAIVIGVTYDRILAGGSESVRAPGQLSSWWPSFLAWADMLADRVAKRELRNEQRFVDRIVDNVVNNEDRFSQLLRLAKTHSDDVAELDQALSAVNAEVQRNRITDEHIVRERKARAVFERVASLSDFQYRLKEQGVISRWSYLWYGKEGRTAALFAIVILSLVMVAIPAVRHFTQPTLWTDYYTWRMRKPNTTELDQHRASQHLRATLKNDNLSEGLMKKLSDLLMHPDLPVERVNRILHLLLQSQASEPTHKSNLPMLLISSLHVQNSDVRWRIHGSLLYLAEHWSLEIQDEEIRNWRSSESESISDLERRIKEWKKVFQGT